MKNIYKTLSLNIVFLIGLLNTSPVLADLVYLDNEKVLDSNTGLLWLNTSLTTGLEENNFYTESGWRFANLSELNSLFIQDDIDEISLLLFLGGQDEGINFIGNNSYSIYATLTNDDGTFDEGVARIELDGVYNGNTLLFGLFFQPLGYTGEITELFVSQSIAGYSNPFESHFLVKSVPVPASIYLFVSGLIGLLGLIHHRR